jgi:hypothetical protein
MTSRKQPLLWDATLSVELVIVTGFAWVASTVIFAMVAVGYRALAFPTIPNPGSLVVMASLALVASALGAKALGGWRNARGHSRRWLILAAFLGTAAAVLTGEALQPWPDLLSDEVARAGQTRFFLEVGKTFVPWLAAALAAFAILRTDPHVGDTRE